MKLKDFLLGGFFVVMVKDKIRLKVWLFGDSRFVELVLERERDKVSIIS